MNELLMPGCQQNWSFRYNSIHPWACRVTHPNLEVEANWLEMSVVTALFLKSEISLQICTTWLDSRSRMCLGKRLNDVNIEYSSSNYATNECQKRIVCSAVLRAMSRTTPGGT